MRKLHLWNRLVWEKEIDACRFFLRRADAKAEFAILSLKTKLRTCRKREFHTKKLPAPLICCGKKKAARKEETKSIGAGRRPFFEKSCRQGRFWRRKREENLPAENLTRRIRQRKGSLLQRAAPKNRVFKGGRRQRRAAERQAEILREREKGNRREAAAQESLLRLDWERKDSAEDFLFGTFPAAFFGFALSAVCGRLHPALEI